VLAFNLVGSYFLTSPSSPIFSSASKNSKAMAKYKRIFSCRSCFTNFDF